MKKGQKQKKYLIGGERLTVRQIAKQPWCPVKESTIYARLGRGMNIVEAITTKPHQTRKKYLYKGKMRSAAYLAELPECKVSRGTLWQRLVVLKWPLAKALLTPKYPDKGYKERTPNMTKEEREYWDNWLITPLEVILKRCEEHWEAERAGGLPQRKTPGWGRQI